MSLSYSFIIVSLLLANSFALHLTKNSDIDLLINEFMEQNRVPALSLGILDLNEGGSAITTAYGFQDVEEQIPAEDTTYFAIGSITKVCKPRIYFDIPI